jgi:hypothetical protein
LGAAFRQQLFQIWDRQVATAQVKQERAGEYATTSRAVVVNPASARRRRGINCSKRARSLHQLPPVPVSIASEHEFSRKIVEAWGEL